MADTKVGWHWKLSGGGNLNGLNNWNYYFYGSDTPANVGPPNTNGGDVFIYTAGTLTGSLAQYHDFYLGGAPTFLGHLGNGGYFGATGNVTFQGASAGIDGSGILVGSTEVGPGTINFNAQAYGHFSNNISLGSLEGSIRGDLNANNSTLTADYLSAARATISLKNHASLTLDSLFSLGAGLPQADNLTTTATVDGGSAITADSVNVGLKNNGLLVVQNASTVVATTGLSVGSRDASGSLIVKGLSTSLTAGVLEITSYGSSKSSAELTDKANITVDTLVVGAGTDASSLRVSGGATATVDLLESGFGTGSSIEVTGTDSAINTRQVALQFSLAITNGGKLTASEGAGFGFGADSSVTITGADSVLDVANLSVGRESDATVTVSDSGSLLVSDTMSVGGDAEGTVTIDRALLDVGTLAIGGEAAGLVTAKNNALLQATKIVLGAGEAQGTLVISTGSDVSATENVAIGNQGTGLVTVTNAGSSLTTERLGVGYASRGELDISDTAEVHVDDVEVGHGAEGTLEITSGGHLFVSDNIGIGVGEAGEVSVDGPSSGMSVEGGIAVAGQQATGKLIVMNGGLVEADHMKVGAETAGLVQLRSGGKIDLDHRLSIASGTVSVDGIDSSLVAEAITIGDGAAGFLSVSNGSSVEADFIKIATDQAGRLDVLSGSSLTLKEELYVGLGATGQLTVDGSDTELDSNALYLGLSAKGSATVSRSAALNIAELRVGGFDGNGSLFITSDASVTTDTANVGVQGTGSVEVRDAEFAVGDLFVGGNAQSDGRLEAFDADVSAYQVAISTFSGSVGRITLHNSDLSVATGLKVGLAGEATLEVTDGSTVTAATVGIGVGAGEGAVVVDDATIDAGKLTVGGGGGEASLEVFNGGIVRTSDLTLSGGRLSVHDRGLIIVGQNSVDADAAAVIIEQGAHLKGNGLIVGDVLVETPPSGGGLHVEDGRLAITGELADLASDPDAALGANVSIAVGSTLYLGDPDADSTEHAFVKNISYNDVTLRVFHAGSDDDIFDFQSSPTSIRASANIDGSDNSWSLSGAIASEGDLLKLPGMASDYNFEAVWGDYGATWAGTTVKVTGGPSGGFSADLVLQNVERVSFADKSLEHVALTGQNMVVEAAQLAWESYEGIPNQVVRPHAEFLLSSQVGAIDKQTITIGTQAALRGWHPVSALEMGILPGDFAHDPDLPDARYGTLQYALDNGVYMARDPGQSFDPVEKALLEWGRHKGLVDELPQADATVFVGNVDGKNTLAITFRGTDQFSDFADYTNFDRHYAKYAPLIDGIKAYLANPEHRVDQVMVSGHSLGASMVQLFLRESFLQEIPAAEDGIPSVYAYTFGSPGSELQPPDNLARHLLNFVNTEDPVAKVPDISSADGKEAIAQKLATLFPPSPLAPLAAYAAAQLLASDFAQKDRSGFDVRFNNEVASENDGVSAQLYEHDIKLYLSEVAKLTSFANDPSGPLKSFVESVANIGYEDPANQQPIQFAMGGPSGSLDPNPMSTVYHSGIRSQPGDDYVLGNPVADLIDWLGADDSTTYRVVDGALGYDTVLFAGSASDWIFTDKGNHLDVFRVGIGNVGELWNVERARFLKVSAANPYGEINFDGSATSVVNAVAVGNVVNVASGPDVTRVGLGNLTVVGSGGSDGIYFDAGNKSIFGGDGDDVILAKTSSSTDVVDIDGGLGADVMKGGRGENTFHVDNVGDLVIDNGGRDTVLSTVSYALAAGIENLTLIASATAATGNDKANILVGNSADNVLNGGRGADTMSGGAGDDIYVVDNHGDIVNEADGDGIDTVKSSVSSNLGDASHVFGSVENLMLTGTGNTSGTGNGLDNVIIGNAGNNKLAGMAGADQLDGGDGIDTATYAASASAVNVSLKTGQGFGGDAQGDTLTHIENLTGSAFDDTLEGDGGANVLNGGRGADTMSGGAGDDTYVVDNHGDIVNEADGDGIDTVKSSVSFNLGDASHVFGSVENLMLTGTGNTSGTGNALDNVIMGGTGSNTLAGMAGADQLDGGDGIDTATYAASASGVNVSLKTGQGFGGDAQGDTLTHIENLTGSAFDDTLEGDGGANVLNGGRGADTMSGGAGDDTYVVDNHGDIVNEADGDGIDTVKSSVSFNLGDASHVFGSVENLMLTGTGNTSGTGNGLDNVIIGNAGNNTLAGMAGADQLEGGDGIDTATYAASASAVNVSLKTGQGFGGDAQGDTLTHIENLTGSAFDDTLEGDGGANVLNGGRGADTMSGGAGDDTYVVDNHGDIVNEADGDGIDTVKSSVSFNLDNASHVFGSVENLTLTGTGNTSGTGNALDNVIIGNAGNNVLAGGDGNDWLEGGFGADVLTGGAGRDSFVFTLPDNGKDVITDFQSGVDVVLIDAFGFGAVSQVGAPPILYSVSDKDLSFSDKEGCFIFDNAGQDSGTLYWDADGGGGADAVAIALLKGVAAISADDLRFL